MPVLSSDVQAINAVSAMAISSGVSTDTVGGVLSVIDKYSLIPSPALSLLSTAITLTCALSVTPEGILNEVLTESDVNDSI